MCMRSVSACGGGDTGLGKCPSMCSGAVGECLWVSCVSSPCAPLPSSPGKALMAQDYDRTDLVTVCLPLWGKSTVLLPDFKAHPLLPPWVGNKKPHARSEAAPLPVCVQLWNCSGPWLSPSPLPMPGSDSLAALTQLSRQSTEEGAGPVFAIQPLPRAPPSRPRDGWMPFSLPSLLP